MTSVALLSPYLTSDLLVGYTPLSYILQHASHPSIGSGVLAGTDSAKSHVLRKDARVFQNTSLGYASDIGW